MIEGASIDTVLAAPTRRAAPGRTGLLLRALSVRRAQVGLAIVVIVVAIALLGPLLAPHSATAFIAAPYGGPTAKAPFGTDGLGRDVLSRFLLGGRSVLAMSLAATVTGLVGGIAAGLTAAYARGVIDEVLMRLMDVALALPQIVLVLLLVASLGPQPWLIVLTVGLGHAPRVARVTGAAALEVIERDFVRSAKALGEPAWRILAAEVLPNISAPLLVEFGLRLTYSVGAIAAIGFIGFGLQPPAADWGLMINENRIGLSIQPWAVLLPVLAIGLLTVGINLFTDGISQASAGNNRG